MSITFYALNTPEKRTEAEPCNCSEYNDGKPDNHCQCCWGRGFFACYCTDYSEGHKAHPECIACGGEGVSCMRYRDGDMTLANDNALDLLELLEFQREYSGEVPLDVIPAVRRRIMILRGSEAKRASALREARDEQSTIVDRSGAVTELRRSARLIEPARNDEHVQGYLERFNTLCGIAQQHESAICWG